MTQTREALKYAIELLGKLYESPTLTTINALELIDLQLPILQQALDDLEYGEKGLNEWRSVALTNARHAEAARVTARIAIGHLQAVLNKARTFDEQQAADSAARDWLASIGSEP